LVQRTPGEPVEVDPWYLENGQTGVGGQPYGLADPVVGVHSDGDVQCGGGHAGAQAFQYRVATEYGVARLGAGSTAGSGGLVGGTSPPLSGLTLG
jgi:hypothetical protein